jgi:hypothetical protein
VKLACMSTLCGLARMRLHGVEEAWVVHFTTGEFVVWPAALLERREVPVHVMHIKYDSEWRSATIRVDGGPADKVNLA